MTRKRFSIMGSSEFEFEPQELEEKINKRNKFVSESFEKINSSIDKLAMEYMKEGLGSYNSFKESIIKKLISDII